MSSSSDDSSLFPLVPSSIFSPSSSGGGTTLTIPYAKIITDPEEPEYKCVRSLYHTIAVFEEDDYGVQNPTMYFVPRTVQLPKGLKPGYIRVTYDSLDEKGIVRYNEGATLVRWLKKNAEHVLDVDCCLQVANRRVEKMECKIRPSCAEC